MSNFVSSIDPSAYYVPPAPKAPAGLNMATFLRLLTVQMASQNPLEPMKDSDLFGQISQLGQVQGMENLQNQGNFTKAQALIGKSITAVDSSSIGNPLISGVVDSISIASDGKIKLNVFKENGSMISVGIDSIQQVLDSTNPNPTTIPADYAFLIGKQVSGVNGTTNISGLATGIGVTKGVIMVDVLNSAGVKLQLPVGSVTSIS